MIKIEIMDYDTGRTNKYIGTEEECEYVLRRDYPHETMRGGTLVECAEAVNDSGAARVKYEVHRESEGASLFNDYFDLDRFPEDPKSR